ncbi:hypothetical protein Syun_022468 [Stephania yunnanensis]|uniref:sucrose synthase n=1 Tax=Stephania yunnanensis TaxID=152371 RepID=A0AAP0FE78_9MAGN
MPGKEKLATFSEHFDDSPISFCMTRIVYILDQVKALEEELIFRMKKQGLSVTPQILVVTRLIPDAQGTKCNQELEAIFDTKYSQILQVCTTWDPSTTSGDS